MILIIPGSYAEDSESSGALPHSKNFYFGGGLGAGINFFSATNTSVTPSNPDHASFAWRLFTGYNVNKNLAVELGYTNFGFYENSALGNSICDTSGACGYQIAKPYDGVFNTQVNVVNQIQAYAIDLTAIGKYNLTDSLNLFGKLGVSYLQATLDIMTTVSPLLSASGTPLGPTINESLTATNKNSILPVIGLGYEYNPNNLMGIKFEYDYYYGTEMIDQNGINQGKLYPSSIMLTTVFNL